MEIFNYCKKCKKSLDCNNFDKKKNGDYYTRYKVCRKNNNENEIKKYVKRCNNSSYRSLCNNDKCVKCFETSFASYDKKTENNKLKVDCWHPSKNKGKTPRDVFKSSNSKFWFQCDICNHNFESSLNNISGKNNTWCMYCSVSSRKLCSDKDCNYCFNKSFASYDKKTENNKLKVDCWHPSKNKGKTPRDVFKSSNSKFWFQCDICNHNFESSLNNISGKNNTWCMYCSVSSRKLCSDKDCNYCFNKSFASYNGKTANDKLKIDCWHSTKNKGKTSRDVFKQSNKKFWFRCDVCNHDFDSVLSSISGKKSWCPYCCVPSRKLCKDRKDCKGCNYCFNKSFASYNGKTKNGKLKVDCWHSTKNKGKTPRKVFKLSGDKFWFQCDVCNHNFESSLNNISGNNRWCPYCCVPSRKLCSDKDCNYCFNKSFASYNGKTANDKLKIDCWHPTKNKGKTPRDITISSEKKCWFQCDVCNHDFDSLISSISRRNTWCPHCKNKTELKLYNWLLKQLNIKEVKREYKPKWCSTQFRHINKKNEFKDGKYQYRYDFLVTFNNKKKLIIELDGRQHFEQVSNWKSPFENQIRDKYKEFLAKKHKIFFIRCIQKDVFMDRNNWEKKLRKKLKKYN